jgi:hypothetical protein
MGLRFGKALLSSFDYKLTYIAVSIEIVLYLASWKAKKRIGG